MSMNTNVHVSSSSVVAAIALVVASGLGCKSASRENYNLGKRYLEGRGVAKDAAHAAALFNQACEGGFMEGCVQAGMLYADGGEVTKDLAKAVELYKRACDRGVGSGCYALGVAYAISQSVTKDEGTANLRYQDAIRLLGESCRKGDMSGCAQLGMMHANGQGVTANPGAAMSFYQQACAGGDMLGCSSLGEMYDNGRGAQKDEVKAAALFKQACDAGTQLNKKPATDGKDASSDKPSTDSPHRTYLVLVTPQSLMTYGGEAAGCAGLAELYDAGRGVEKDGVKAARLFKQACDAGYPLGCMRERGSVRMTVLGVAGTTVSFGGQGIHETSSFMLSR
jgi:TPR repeat protein